MFKQQKSVCFVGLMPGLPKHNPGIALFTMYIKNLKNRHFIAFNCDFMRSA